MVGVGVDIKERLVDKVGVDIEATVRKTMCRRRENIG